ncbi:protein of unknown function [Rubritalea squalenifaciens DSM 18772]|uniref:DUF4325 domain-containing protein n=1 Tax=Rubritalea squalenifaciens DSM 18772 TaxID=1123071 RepID=A0A1M6PL93_9BACT|nr:STAS-like domain-containing protein [Rubritalea squalenifaciens]SHK08668.1 protein of unknown function [Rubritalea squalenifaciens DSM 18772]
MKHEINITEHFGARLSNGEEAYAFRISNIAPYANLCDPLVIDFTGVRSANSSFINALIGALFEDHGRELLKTLTFKGCLPTIQVLVEAAIQLGLTKHAAARS